MSRYLRIDVPGYPRHIGIRGVDGMQCFRSDRDFHVFMKYLREALGRGGCALHTFVLMPNHVHLLATPEREGVVATIMHSVASRYARYFNAAYERTGPLFEGRYWSSLIETRPYFFSTMRYIELNPVRAGMVDQPGSYPWSGFLHNTGRERREELTFHDEFLALGRTPAECFKTWAAIVNQGVSEVELARLRKHFRRNRPLGGDAFLAQFEKKKDVPGTCTGYKIISC